MINSCLDCGINISRRAKRCSSCATKEDRKNPLTNPCYKGGRPKCIDCGIEINYRSKRCKECSHEYFRHNPRNVIRGKEHYNFKDGKSTIQHYCIDCNKKIYFNSLRCRSCARKGDKHPNYKDGNTLLKYFCKDCNKEISSKNRTRCQSCAVKFLYKCGVLSFKGRRGLVKELNPNWKGGISFESYPQGWSVALKEQIRERDNHMCQICGKKQIKCKLSVHHMDYCKENLDPSNLISLCRSCHAKTNHNRAYWYADVDILRGGLIE